LITPEKWLALQAERQTNPGHAFGPTPDGRRSSNTPFRIAKPRSTKRDHRYQTDMEQPQPMDRLICGDVGFGKTEVAIRAAFKAVMDGKQVAVLAPHHRPGTTAFSKLRGNTMLDFSRIRIEMA